jgi:DNA-binding winged helix-turn-helix (wHTH) protein
VVFRLLSSRVELDTERFEFRRNGEVLRVQPKVLRLLAYLAEHRERTVPIAELLERVWPEETVTPGSVKRAIFGARRALGEDAGSECSIRSIRGVGYRFVGAVEVAPQNGAETRAVSETRLLAAAPVESFQEPFVGREWILELLDASLRQARGVSDEHVILSGEPGIGKSRTVQEFGALAGREGAEVWMGRCLEEDGAPPFWPWIQVLRECVRCRGASETRALLDNQAADLAQTIPELRVMLPEILPAPAIEAAAARFRAFDAMATLLRRAAERRPVVLVFEDLQRGDRDTLKLLDFVAQQPSCPGLLLLSTLRRGIGAREGTAELVRKITSRQSAKVIELPGWQRDEVARYLEAFVGPGVPSAVSDALHERTAGNPLFCRQLLLRFRARHRPGEAGEAPEAEGWKELTDATTSAGLHEASERHLEIVSVACRGLLQAASVLGGGFSLAMLVRLTEGTLADARALLREAIDAGIVHSLPDGDHFRFTHALVRDVLYARTAEPERRRLHACAGIAIEEWRAELDDEALTEAAHHFYQAAPEDEGLALDYAEQAARAAASRLAHEEAVIHLDRALHLLELAAPDPARRLPLLLAKGQALTHALCNEAARAVLLEAFMLAKELGNVEAMVEVVVLLSANPETGTVDRVRIDLLRQTLSFISEDDPRRPLVTALLAKALCYSGEPTERARFAREALAGARLLEEPALRAQALDACHLALSEPDDLASRIEIADELSGLAEKHGGASSLLRASTAQIGVGVETGDMGIVDAALATIEAVVERVREPFFKWHAVCIRSMRSMVDGALAHAESEALQAFALGKRLNAESAYHTYVTQVWSLYWLSGRVREAEALVRDVSARYPCLGGWRAVLAGIDLDLGRELPARRALARLLCELGDETRDAPFLLSALCPLADLCGRIGDDRMASKVYEKLVPYARHHGFVHLGIATHGPVSRHLGVLAARMGDLDLALEHLSDAVARAERMGSPSFSALCSFTQARVLLAKGGCSAHRRAALLLRSTAFLSTRIGMSNVAAHCRAIAERFAIDLREEPMVTDG